MVGVCDEFVSDGECNYATCLSLLTSIHALLIDHQAFWLWSSMWQGFEEQFVYRCGLELVSWRASNLFPNLLLNVCVVCLCTKDVAAAILFLLRLQSCIFLFSLRLGWVWSKFTQRYRRKQEIYKYKVVVGSSQSPFQAFKRAKLLQSILQGGKKAHHMAFFFGHADTGSAVCSCCVCLLLAAMCDTSSQLNVCV